METKEYTVTFEESNILKKIMNEYSKDFPFMTFKDCKINDNNNLLITFKYNLSPYTKDQLYNFSKSSKFEESFLEWKKNN